MKFKFNKYKSKPLYHETFNFYEVIGLHLEIWFKNKRDFHS